MPARYVRSPSGVALTASTSAVTGCPASARGKPSDLVPASRPAIRQLVEEAGLITRSDDRLFEMLATFAMIDALWMLDWMTEPLRVISGSLQLMLVEATRN
jgi:hypothetical protein